MIVEIDNEKTLRDGLKLTVFRHHWWIGLGIGLVVTIMIFVAPVLEKTTAVAAVLATVLSIIFFVQQQKLAEMTLFKQLITEFNQRYDRINGNLETIGLEDHLNRTKKHPVIVDYFNLCAEEYLFFIEGYIHRRVWRSWCRGMLQYSEKEPFSSLWAQESSTDSYYGLTVEEMRKGAR